MPYVTSFERAGIEKGRQEGEALALLRLIERKFGEEAKEAYQARVEEGSLDQLERWFDRAIDAKRIEDIFTDR